MNHPIDPSSAHRRPFGGWRRSAATLTSAMVLGSCGGGTELLVVPLFLFGFSDATNQVSVFFNPDQPSTATGTFQSVNFQVGPDQAPLPATVNVTGTWSGCTMSLTLAGNPSAPIASAYRGAFIDRDTIRLTPDPAQAGRPVLNIKRGGTAPGAPNCP
jgi:hypothetical protein